ncbi:MAG TPA: hypothetical protein GXX51_06425 [Firmicutes bacterium]|nr:hypothetical protein [Bacillota bacterium]
MADARLEPPKFEEIDKIVASLAAPAPPPGTQQATWVQARTTWFRQSEGSASILWIATTDQATVYRTVDQSWLAAWQTVIMECQALWLQVDANNYIRAWQPGRSVG